MNNKKCIKITFFIIFLINVSIAWAGSGNLDFKVLSSSDAGCTVDFSSIHFQIDTLIINETKYNKVNFDMSGPSGEPGDPLIPCRTFVVGIPLDGGVKVSVTTSDFSEKQGIRLIPVPVLKEKNRFPFEVYKEGEAYKKSGFLPGVLYEAEEPAFFGEQRIVRVTVFPVQFNPLENKIRLYTKIILRIDFQGRGDTVQDFEKIKTRLENLYQKSMINYSEAKKWRLRREKKLKKVSKIFETGEWYKIPVSDEKEGIFKVSGSFLKNNGIDISSIQPSTLKIYNNGGRELPRDLSIPRPDSLIENPIILAGIEDGRFDESDYFLFYGKGIRNWEFNTSKNQYNHYNNIYTNQNIYWLTFNDGIQGKRIRTVSPLSEQGSQHLNSFRDRFFLEQEIYNPLEGSIHWLGFQFSDQTPNKSYSLTFSDPVSDDTIRFRFHFAGVTSGTHRCEIRFNNQLIKEISFSGYQENGIRFTPDSVFLYRANISNNVELSFQYQGPGIAPTAYLDWFELEYGRKLKASGSKLRFFSPSETGYYTYNLTGFSSEPLVLDVTDISDVRRMQIRSVSGGWNFTDSVTTEGPRFYQASETSGYLAPEGIEIDQVSDLRNPDNSAELVIITHKDFYEQALRLKTLREEHDSLSVFVADIQDVYDEFGWGLLDPAAIRDFIKHACENWTVCPSYLLLFGDGDYDYRNIRSDRDKNWIPPFERDGTAKESASRATDDWFTYVIGDDYQMDLAVGRLPVQSEQEAKIVVDKIVQYETEPELSEWRSIITIVGDDEKTPRSNNETTHITASESLSNIIPSIFNFKKIFLTEYPEVILVDGRQKPQVNDDLVEQINQGTLLVNYTGHGNEDIWSDEEIFVKDRDLPRLHNEKKLPLFYAATCAFALYDNPDKQSFSEQLLNSEGKGAIAVIAASRWCIATANEALNKGFMDTLFNDTGPTERIGNSLRLAKLNYRNTANNEMYNILGDPAMRLGMPRHSAVFTKMEPNTFKALSVIKVEGKVEKDGAAWTDFNGKIALKGFDSKKNIAYTTEGGSTLRYKLPGNALFRGEAKVQKGQFQFSFVVPKDISYGGQSGRLSCYFWNEETDGAGYRDLIKVGGSADLVDNQGPEIELYFTEQENFVTGEMVPEEPEIVAAIQDDKSGINITGEIGHKIIMTIDQEKQDVTEHFQYDEGSHLQGKLVYRLTGVKTGEHELSIKAWDNANNSATQYLNFNVVTRGDLIIEDVLNYPNPFSTSTSFTFQINQNAKVEIKVFTVSGRLIQHLDDYWAEAGFNMIPWNGRDTEGDELANGVYIYKLNAISNINGREIKKSIIERLMVMH